MNDRNFFRLKPFLKPYLKPYLAWSCNILLESSGCVLRGSFEKELSISLLSFFWLF